MLPTKAAIAAFLFFVAFIVILLIPAPTRADELREMIATGNGAQFVITNQPCEIDFHEPTPFKYHAYVVMPDGVYAACWYDDDAAIWLAVDHFRQIVALNPYAFQVKPPEPKQESF